MEFNKLKCLKYALVVIGLFFIFGVYTMMHLAPASWAWEPRQPEYEYMIMGIYVTLGFFLLKAAKNPMEHKSLIDFTIWSSVVHASIMLIQALRDSDEHPNMLGDILGLYVVALVLFVLMPKNGKTISQNKDDAS